MTIMIDDEGGDYHNAEGDKDDDADDEGDHYDQDDDDDYGSGTDRYVR